MSQRLTLDDALTNLGRADPAFNEEIRRRLAPVKHRFFAVTSTADKPQDGLHATPVFLTDPELREVALGLAEFAVQRGIDVNIAWDSDGSTALHEFALVRDPAPAREAVAWLLAQGADPHRVRDDGQTPYSLALSSGRTEIAELMRTETGI